MCNYIDIEHYNGYGRWYGVDRFIFPVVKRDTLDKELINLRTNEYVGIRVGYSEDPYLDDDNQVEHQVKCFEYPSYTEVLEKVIKRFS